MNNVVNLDKYRAKVIANEIFDTVEDSVQEFMYESINVIQKAGLDPTDSVQDKMIAISMLFRAMDAQLFTHKAICKFSLSVPSFSDS